MQAVPKLGQEDITKILGDNQNFLMLLKVLLAHRDEDTIEVPFEELEKVAPLGIRIEPVFDSTIEVPGTPPSKIKLTLVMPEEKSSIIVE